VAVGTSTGKQNRDSFEGPRDPSSGGHASLAALLLSYIGLSVFFGGAAIAELRRYPLPAGAAVGIYLCFSVLLFLFLAPGFAASRSWLARRLGGLRAAGLCLALFVSPYLIYAVGTGGFQWAAFGKLLALGCGPLGIYAAAPVRDPGRMSWQDAVVMLWLALPVLFGWIGGIWNVPINLDFMARLFVVSLGAWSFLFWRGIEDAGYEFRFSGRAIRQSLVQFVGAFFFDLVTIFLFIGVPEELLFRGFLQNLLEKSWNARYRAQAAASALFGLSHILHASFPNWRYVMLASAAGWFYGSAYRKTRSLMASATTHALVDTVWRTWFTK